MQKTPVTICINGFLGVTIIEANMIAHGVRTWAQYVAAPYVDYVPKGKRKVLRWQGGYNPFCVVLAGHLKDRLDSDRFAPAETTQTSYGQVSSSSALYSACDPRWQTDFNKRLAALPETVIIADYRSNKSG